MITEAPPENLTLQELTAKVLVLSENLDFFFLGIMGIIISFMQIGFGYLEAGSVNSKNASNVMFKNMMDSMLCGTMFWLIGYTIAFGEGSSFFGLYYYQGGKDMTDRKQYSHFFFQLSYASTPATIVSGAVVDRISLIAYIVYSSAISGIIYPTVVHWAWHNEGWLMKFGFKDFCGSGVVHLTGGTCAIVGAVILGPRIGRFPKPGTELSEREKMRFTYHNAAMAGLGGMILYTGWFAFNGGSVLHITKHGDGEAFAKIMVNTWLASSGAIIGSLFWFKLGLVDGDKRFSFMNAINSGVSAMASICAHADAVDMWAAFLNGLIISFTYSYIKKLVHKLKIDDPIDVIAVHFGGGIWGTIGGTLLRDDSLVKGYFYNAGWYFAKNLAGALAIMLWSSTTCIIMFGGLRLLGLLRVSPEDELLGADLAKHHERAYIGICDCEYLHKKYDNNDPIVIRNNHAARNSNQSEKKIEIYDTSKYYNKTDPGIELQERISHQNRMSQVDL